MLERWNERLRGHRFAAGAALVALVLVLFSGALANGFVYDDIPQIIQNPFIRNARLWKHLFSGSVWSSVGVAASYYRPLQSFCWWLLYRLDGANFAAFHLLQLLFFTAAVGIVFRIGLELLQNDLAALVGALLWALHPQRVEAVAWVSALGDVGAGLFYVLGFWLFLRAEKRGAGRWAAHALAAAAFLLALLFKEMALSFPLLIGAYWFFFPNQESWLKRATRFAPYAAALGIYLAIRGAAVGELSLAGKPLANPTRVAAVAMGLFGWHTRLFFWPAHLNDFRTFDPSASLRSPWPWAGILVVLAALLFRQAQPGLGFLILWWPLALAPCLDYRQLSWLLVSDRFSFLPSVGLCLAIAWLAAVWLPKRFAGVPVRRCVYPALALLAVFWGAETVRAIPRWRDNRTLFDYSARQSPHSALVHMNKAWDLQYRDGDLDGAAREFQTALRLESASFGTLYMVRYDAYLGLGHIALAQGRDQEAVECFRKAIRLHPTLSPAYDSLASFYFAHEDFSRAVEYFSQAVGHNPQDVLGRFYLGTCLMKLGEYRKAAGQFHAAWETDPSYAPAYAAEARALEAAGDAAGAARVRALAPPP